LNASGIGLLITGTSEETTAEALGLHDFCITPVYPLIVDQTGLWNYCEGYYRADLDWTADIEYCSPQSSGYSFDPISIISTELNPGYTIVFIQPEEDAITRIHDNSVWLKSAFIIGAMFYGFTLIFGCLTGVWSEAQILNCAPVLGMCCGIAFWLAGAITATNIYFNLRNVFSADIGLNIEGHMGRQMFAWIWLGFGFSLVAWGQWCCAAICCPGGHRKRRIAWKKRIKIQYDAADM